MSLAAGGHELMGSGVQGLPMVWKKVEISSR